jgi:hypothetical protein
MVVIFPIANVGDLVFHQVAQIVKFPKNVVWKVRSVVLVPPDLLVGLVSKPLLAFLVQKGNKFRGRLLD